MKIIMFALVIGSITNIANAQSKEVRKDKMSKQTNVPSIVKDSFATEFPGKTSVWEIEKGQYEAEFKVNGAAASATYTLNGHRLAFEIAVEISAVPVISIQYIKANYPNYKITETSKIVSDNNIITYEVEVKKDQQSWDIIFDATGKFIKQEKGD